MFAVYISLSPLLPPPSRFASAPETDNRSPLSVGSRLHFSGKVFASSGPLPSFLPAFFPLAHFVNAHRGRAEGIANFRASNVEYRFYDSGRVRGHA